MMKTSRLVGPLAVLLALPGCQDDHPAADAGRDAPSADAASDAPADASTPQPVRLAGLAAPVTVSTDAHGWPHIRGASITDVARVQGYLQAKDRIFQMELFRRNASGTLAQIAGSLSPTILDGDINARVVGYRRTAQQIWDATPPGEERDVLTAFAEGVTAYIRELRSGAASLPRGSNFIPVEAIGDWTPVDTLTVIRLQHGVQSLDLSDIYRSNVVRLARERFAGADPTSPLHLRRGIAADLFRIAPLTDTTTLPHATAMARACRARPLRRRDVAAPALAAGERFREVAEGRLAMLATRSDRGSNEWGVRASATRDHRALLASDPHVSLPSPPLFWGTHITVTGDHALDAAGSIIAGVPGVLIGFTRRVAWGLTNANYDQTDVFQVTVTRGTGGAPDTVRRNGRDVPIEVVHEMIPTDTGSTVDVALERVPELGYVIPTVQNGRVMPRTGDTALVLRWTGNEPSHELVALLGVMRANDGREARAALSAFGGPSLNWTIADANGDITYSTQSYVPLRAPGARTWDPTTNPTGTLPCFVLPGDGTADWTGRVPPEMLPQGEATADRPYVVNANNDQAGYTLDGNPLNDPVFLTCFQDPGFRAQRITARLTEVMGRATADDMESIQGDHRMEYAARMRPSLAEAMTHLAEERARPGAHPDLAATVASTAPRAARLSDAAARIAAWSLQTPAGVEHEGSEAERADAVATTLFHIWAFTLVDVALGDEARALGVSVSGLAPLLSLLEHPERAATLDPATGQSALWDDLDTPSVVESRDATIVKALDQALMRFESTAGGPDLSTWLWGRFHTITFSSLVPSLGAAQTIPGADEPMYPRGYPRHGGFYVVDASFPQSISRLGYAAGPGHRLVVELDATGPRARIALPGGESIDPDSPHHRDEAALYRVNRSHPVPFTEAEVEAAATSRQTFTP